MMARRPSTFKQQDATRAARAAIAAGLEVQRIEIDPNGKIVVVTTGKPAAAANEWDEVLSRDPASS